jgi:hypothetical protein
MCRSSIGIPPESTAYGHRAAGTAAPGERDVTRGGTFQE